MVWMPASVAASFHEKCVCASHMPGMSVAPAPSRIRTFVNSTLFMRVSPVVSGCGRARPSPGTGRTSRRPPRRARLPDRRGAVEGAVLHHGEDALAILQHRDVDERVAVDEQD